jgi:benzodiazapine receptor
MEKQMSRGEGLKSFLVIAATIGVIVFNWLAAGGYVNGVTPEMISDKYPTLVTPAGYAFTIWSLIYFGLAVFSIYQALPKNAERFRGIRSLYILNCAANCAWIFFWHQEQILFCLLVILALLATLLLINIKIKNTETNAEFWLVKAPFGIYFGWVTVAAMVNFAVALKYLNAETFATSTTGTTGAIVLSCVFILLAAFFGVLVRIKLGNYLYPLAVAWAVTAIAVKQSGQTLIVVAAAVACIVSLFAALSFVLTEGRKPGSDA